jgi:hypothetical protein
MKQDLPLNGYGRPYSIPFLHTHLALALWGQRFGSEVSGINPGERLAPALQLRPAASSFVHFYVGMRR